MMAVFFAGAVCEFVSWEKHVAATNMAKRDVRNFFMRRNIISRAGKDNGIARVAADPSSAATTAEGGREEALNKFYLSLVTSAATVPRPPAIAR